MGGRGGRGAGSRPPGRQAGYRQLAAFTAHAPWFVLQSAANEEGRVLFCSPPAACWTNLCSRRAVYSNRRTIGRVIPLGYLREANEMNKYVQGSQVTAKYSM